MTVETVAAIIAPSWFPDNGPHHVLNNYPGQAEKFRADAREQAKAILEALKYEELVEALRFYADEWEQDVDAEQTVHGWVGSIGETSPSEKLYRDRGSVARAALSSLKDR